MSLNFDKDKIASQFPVSTAPSTASTVSFLSLQPLPLPLRCLLLMTLYLYTNPSPLPTPLISAEYSLSSFLLWPCGCSAQPEFCSPMRNLSFAGRGELPVQAPLQTRLRPLSHELTMHDLSQFSLAAYSSTCSDAPTRIQAWWPLTSPAASCISPLLRGLCGLRVYVETLSGLHTTLLQCL